MTRESL